jgi:hypothetical protein
VFDGLYVQLVKQQASREDREPHVLPQRLLANVDALLDDDDGKTDVKPSPTIHA